MLTNRHEFLTLTFLNCQTHGELFECVAEVHEYATSENRRLAYLAVLQKLPLEHCGTAAIELFEKLNWMPKPAEWRETAMQHWQDAKRRELANNPQLGNGSIHQTKEQLSKTRLDLHDYVRSEAAKGDELAQALLSNLEQFGTLGRPIERLKHRESRE